MSEGTHLSAGEIGGIFAGVAALITTIVAGTMKLLGWKGRREVSRAKRNQEWEERLQAREDAFEAEQRGHWSRLDARLARAELKVEALLNGHHLLSGALREKDPDNAALAMADELLKAAFRLDPIVPDEMKAEAAAAGSALDQAAGEKT